MQKKEAVIQSKTNYEKIQKALEAPYPDDEYLKDQQGAYESARDYVVGMQISETTLKERFTI